MAASGTVPSTEPNAAPGGPVGRTARSEAGADRAGANRAGANRAGEGDRRAGAAERDESLVETEGASPASAPQGREAAGMLAALSALPSVEAASPRRSHPGRGHGSEAFAPGAPPTDVPLAAPRAFAAAGPPRSAEAALRADTRDSQPPAPVPGRASAGRPVGGPAPSPSPAIEVPPAAAPDPDGLHPEGLHPGGPHAPVPRAAVPLAATAVGAAKAFAGRDGGARPEAGHPRTDSPRAGVAVALPDRPVPSGPPSGEAAATFGERDAAISRPTPPETAPAAAEGARMPGVYRPRGAAERAAHEAPVASAGERPGRSDIAISTAPALSPARAAPFHADTAASEPAVRGDGPPASRHEDLSTFRHFEARGVAEPGLPGHRAEGAGAGTHGGRTSADGGETAPAFTAALASGSPPAAHPQGPLPTVGQPGAGSPELLARQVAPQIAAAVISEPAPGELSVALDPPELGRVEIRLDLRDDLLRVTVAAERGATGELLRRHADILLAELRSAGFTGAALDFAGNRHGGREASITAGRSAPNPARELPETERVAPAPLDRPAAPAGRGLDLRL